MSNFYIPEPCHEKWDRMQLESNGRHCAVCEKTVIDFTGKTPAEIDDIFNTTTSQVCGRFTFDQLNRDAQMKVFRNPRNLFNHNWKYFALSFLGFLAWGKKAQAQAPAGGAPVYVAQPTFNTDTIKISGTISRPDHKPAGGAKITFSLNGHIIGKTIALPNGTYVYRIPPGKISGSTIDVAVDYTGFPQKTTNGLNLSDKNIRLNIVVGEMVKLMGIKKKAK